MNRVLLATALAMTLTFAAESSFEVNHGRAEYLAHQGKFAEAIPFFEKARASDPSHYANGYDLALAYTETGKLVQARAQIESMLASKDRAELQNLLGLVEERSGNIQAAADRYQRAAQSEPSEKHVFDLGNCFLRYHGAKEAIEIFRFGVKTYPNSARMRVGLGVAAYALGDYDNAVKVLCEGVDLDPKDARPIYFLGKMYDISPLLADEVTKRLAHFVETYPNNATVNYYYALSLWKRLSGTDGPESLATVEKYLKRAISLDNTLADAHFQLGILYDDGKQTTAAVREFEQAVKLDPAVDKYRYRLGQAYAALGEKTKAQEQLRVFRELHSKKQETPSR